MQRTRPISSRLYGMGFVLVVTFLIFFVYAVFVFSIVGPEYANLDTRKWSRLETRRLSEDVERLSRLSDVEKEVERSMQSSHLEKYISEVNDFKNSRNGSTIRNKLVPNAESVIHSLRLRQHHERIRNDVMDQDDILNVELVEESDEQNGEQNGDLVERRNLEAAPVERKLQVASPLIEAGGAVTKVEIKTTDFIFLWNWITPESYKHLYEFWLLYIGTIIMVIFHILFFLHLIAFYNAIMTDPGMVPSHWGFYMGDETKRRRYCKMCNVWKPDRTHHCSICSRCILNMDHHCPWINNCVGFYNRKFFMQFVIYVWVCLAIVIVYSLPILIDKLFLYLSLIDNHIGFANGGTLYETFQLNHLVMLAGYAMGTLLGCTLTNFMKFHVKLISENFTTIENLEREENAKSRYDIGWRRNWEQVFGSDLKAWWIPFHLRSSRPVGDGVRWRVHYTRVVDEDEELPGEDENPRTRPMLK